MPPQPGEEPPPERQDLRPRVEGRRPGGPRRSAQEGVRHPLRPGAHELQHVPPMTDHSPSAADLRARLASTKGRAFWRSLEEYSGTPEFAEMLGPRVPAARFRVGRGRQPPTLPRALRRLALPRGPLGLRQAAARGNRPLREAARGDRPGPAAVLRDRRDALRLRDGATRREPRRPPDEDRGQPRPPGEPRRDGRFLAGARPVPLRPRPLADDHASRADPHVGELHGRARRAREDPRGARRRRPADPDADRHVADARRTAPRNPLVDAEGPLAPVGAGRPRRRPCGRPSSPTGRPSRRGTTSRRPTSSSRSTPTRSSPAPAPSPRRAPSRAGGARPPATAASRPVSTPSRRRRPRRRRSPTTGSR